MRWLEILTLPLSLSFRLFGNIFACEVLLATMLTVAPFVLFVFIGLELFVGLIQALIFSMLSLVFLSIATSTKRCTTHTTMSLSHSKVSLPPRHMGSLSRTMLALPTTRTRRFA